MTESGDLKWRRERLISIFEGWPHYGPAEGELLRNYYMVITALLPSAALNMR